MFYNNKEKLEELARVIRLKIEQKGKPDTPLGRRIRELITLENVFQVLDRLELWNCVTLEDGQLVESERPSIHSCLFSGGQLLLVRGPYWKLLSPAITKPNIDLFANSTSHTIIEPEDKEKFLLKAWLDAYFVQKEN